MAIIEMNWGGALYRWITQFSDPIVTRSAKCADMYICVRACCRGSTRVYLQWKTQDYKIERRSNMGHVLMQIILFIPTNGPLTTVSHTFSDLDPHNAYIFEILTIFPLWLYQ